MAEPRRVSDLLLFFGIWNRKLGGEWKCVWQKFHRKWTFSTDLWTERAFSIGNCWFPPKSRTFIVITTISWFSWKCCLRSKWLDWECDILKTSGYVPVLRPFLWPNFAVQKMGVLQKLPISSPASINRPHDLKMTTSIWIKVNKGSGVVKRITS